MRRTLLLLAVASLAGCTSSFVRPANTVDMNHHGYQAERQNALEVTNTARIANQARCADLDIALAGQPVDAGLGASFDEPQLFSPGDLLRVDLPREDDFGGDYVIGPNGYVRLPFIGDLPASGMSTSQLETIIARLLVEGGYYKPGFARASVSVLEWAPIQVSVSGAVFQAGDVLLNQRDADDTPAERVSAAGDIAFQRSLSSALFAAAGVRPDADVRNIVLVRNGRRRVFDMSGALNGGAMDDPLLIAGDRIHVPSRGCFQMALARPSRITPPGIRVFMSNLTQPAASNAASAIGQDATRLPYGTRFLQGLVSANCVGGLQATNAGRWGVLISRNPITGESEVVARSIEKLVRSANRDDYNPVLLPNDAIACYDSHVTNVRDVIAMVSEVAAPALNAAIIGGLAN
ncbi:polysaccharide biosynthesis/export family protein [Henriciella algicola]|uniref:Polysaccharide export protein n=1 Tax=Henriciella algicola TaxID=1608422 RepID=A0A399RIQ5_9PROT|nr:polysaccharide biosynthesis/export family protein [Henriciella algicola]RIJ29625.1 polysaccharide export protein [Henriciella algicola]